MKDLSYKAKIRLYVKGKLEVHQEIKIQSKQLHYLTNVMRRKRDDILSIFNEVDGEFIGKIINDSKRNLTIKLLQKIKDPEKKVDIWVIFAPVKKSSTDFIIQKATELGASCLVPVITERTITKNINLKRMQEIVIEASEQSERITIPEIKPIQKLADVICSWNKNRKIFYGDETERNQKEERCFNHQTLFNPSGAILIGPEGGFAQNEISFLKSKEFVVPINLGPRILRSETAVISGLVFWHIMNGDMKEYIIN
ncbi:MAG: 16S rRNA (uracil(1498)-N(3))-methyltransferase [Alphaproteobacteria bacterium]|nr:16S rRNA (uracil(1498)-N(3))-methyltransferase [Alphaproteobacteria bacterium]